MAGGSDRKSFYTPVTHLPCVGGRGGEIVSSSSVHNRQPTVFSGSNLILDPGSSPLLLPRGRLLWRGRRAPPLYFGYSTAANAMSAFGGGESEKIATKIAL